MKELPLLLAGIQAAAAAFGAAMAVWAELSYVAGLRTHGHDHARRAHLDRIGMGLKIGMTVFLLASLGLVWSSYKLQNAAQPALSTVYWAEVVFALLLITTTWALSKGRMAFPLGSAAVFTAWWLLALLTLGRMSTLTFGGALMLYVVATAVLFGMLSYLRMLFLPKS